MHTALKTYAPYISNHPSFSELLPFSMSRFCSILLSAFMYYSHVYKDKHAFRHLYTPTYIETSCDGMSVADYV